MSYPSQRQIMMPLLDAIAARGGWLWFSVAGDYLERHLAEIFGLTVAEREATSERLPNTKGRRIWRHHIQWARKKLVLEGLMEGKTKDLWSLTDAGRSLAERRGSLGSRPESA